MAFGASESLVVVSGGVSPGMLFRSLPLLTSIPLVPHVREPIATQPLKRQ